VTLGYQFAVAHDEPVTLHLTLDKVTGGQPHIDKRQSWGEIVAVFPDERVKVKSHRAHGLSNKDWVTYLKDKGHVAECYYYKDTYGMHPDEDVFPLDISSYLQTNPCIDPLDCSAKIELPLRYVTMQWDAGRPVSDKRMDAKRRKFIEQSYKDKGYDIVRVGGEAKDERLGTDVALVGYVMAGAAIHVGIDSGPMHLAHVYLPHRRIHLYSTPAVSHHAKRWIANGVVLDHFKP
jgi:hypothetical protein